MTENIEVFTQNSIRITAEGKNIYVDPFQIKIDPHDADYILITHDHYDHFSPEDIEKVSENKTVLIVPEKMEHKAQEVSGYVSKTIAIRPGESYNVDSLAFDTVPSYNIMRPFHPKSAGWVGYILHINGKSIYIAGDTDLIKEIRGIKCDIALVPVGGTYTMDAKKAAEFVNLIEPSVAIPVHYGNLVGDPSDGKKFASNVKESIKVELKIKY
ncbi:MAG: MBL fold metallo-hydrolase [Lachnospiraceae bacterium]|nr:MBL fold metallo-hydrolase [Lachnospiraceae bacterium]